MTPHRVAHHPMSKIKVTRSIREESSGGNTTVDGGANGCVAGRELIPISYTGEDANVIVMGIDKHQLNLPICTCAGVHDLSNGTSILCIFNRYAYHADGNTIHSKIQLQDNGNFVDDCPTKLGGTQKIVTPGGIMMALNQCHSRTGVTEP